MSSSAPRPARCSRRQAGQAAVDYVAVLAVVVAVLVAGGAAAGGGGGGILNGVLRGLERALCRVGGGDCGTTTLSACTVRSREAGGKLQVKFTFAKLGGSFSLLREERSDGSVEVSLVDGVDAAPTAAVGASGGVRLGGAREGAGAIAEAELLVRLGRRRTWSRPDAAAADRLEREIRSYVAASIAERAVPVLGGGVRRLVHAAGVGGDRLPTPDVAGVSAGVEGALAAGLGGVVGGKAAFKASLGGTRERRSGKRTLVLAVEGEASAALSRAMGGATLTGSAGPTLAVTFDRAGTPIELAVSESGTGGADAGLGPLRGRGRTAGVERMERIRRLDLQRGGNGAVWARLVDALAPSGARDLPGAMAALAAQLRTGAREDVTRHGTRRTVVGADAEAALGGRLGGAVEASRTTSELVDAWTRPPGGVWEQRTDCLGTRA